MDSKDYWFDPKSNIKFSKGNLPHRNQWMKYQFVTFRLADSLPVTITDELRKSKDSFLKLHPYPWNQETKLTYKRNFSDKIEYYLNNGIGDCILRNKEIRRKLIEAILYHNEDKYFVDSFVIMPNHVHLLILPLGENEVERVIGNIKKFSAREMNNILHRNGKVWMKENFDRIVRSEDNFKYYRSYIFHNPDKLRAGDFALYYKGNWICQ